MGCCIDRNKVDYLLSYRTEDVTGLSAVLLNMMKLNEILKMNEDVISSTTTTVHNERTGIAENTCKYTIHFSTKKKKCTTKHTSFQLSFMI